MDESPAWALKRKKKSSMRVAIDLIKEGRAEACVSSGNTGALMAMARFVLKTIPGIDRPAIVYAIPGVNSQTMERVSTYMLDLGANVGCSVQHLVQFALMGSILAQHENLPKPRVALLNIGEEDMKGLEVIKDAAQQLSASEHIHYVGFVEGNDIFTAKADVIVCDGFVGNIALKTMEGVARFISASVKSALKKSLLTRFLALFAIPALLKVKRELDLSQYNGASLLGLNGIVIKSHGRSDARALATAISEAVKEVEKQVPSRIRKELEHILGGSS
jgi:glycerol-3-phosphate acyltransferase PlsX